MVKPYPLPPSLNVSCIVLGYCGKAGIRRFISATLDQFSFVALDGDEGCRLPGLDGRVKQPSSIFFNKRNTLYPTSYFYGVSINQMICGTQYHSWTLWHYYHEPPKESNLRSAAWCCFALSK